MLSCMGKQEAGLEWLPSSCQESAVLCRGALASEAFRLLTGLTSVMTVENVFAGRYNVTQWQVLTPF